MRCSKSSFIKHKLRFLCCSSRSTRPLATDREQLLSQTKTMLLLDALAERRIEEARDAGELDNLPGAGQPLPEEDWSMVAEDERIGYRLLKNAGYLPPELELHREAVALALKLASHGEPSAQTARALDRLSRINMLLAEAGKPQLMVPLDYIDQVAGRI